jgi:hypothetical protein
MRKLSLLVAVLAVAVSLVIWAQKPAMDPAQDPAMDLAQDPAMNLAQDPAVSLVPEPAANRVFRVDSEGSRLRVLATPDGRNRAESDRVKFRA